MVESVVAGEGPKQALIRLQSASPPARPAFSENPSVLSPTVPHQGLNVATLLASLTKDECSGMLSGFLGAFPGIAGHSVSLVEAVTQGRCVDSWLKP